MYCDTNLKRKMSRGPRPLRRKRGERFPPALHAVVLLLCLFATGWGPADYEIHLYGDYFILRSGGNVHSLAVKLPPVDASEKSRAFGVVYEGVETYGEWNGIIYGTTVRHEFFVLNPGTPFRIYRERQKWLTRSRD